jgi:hypothetical protein
MHNTPHSEETKKKISEAKKKNPIRFWLGKKRSPESIKKMKESKLKNPCRYWLGKERTPETIEKIRLAHLGKVSRNKGKTMSEESRRRMSIAQKNRFKTQAVWNKGKPMLEITRKKISLKKKGLTSAMKGKKHSDEAKKKMSIAHKGKPAPWHKRYGADNPHYFKDRSLLKKSDNRKYDVAYQEWRKQVKDRDGWKCKIDNNDCCGILEAHHILTWREHPELRYEVNNGITLCKFHHPRKHTEETKLSPYFQELVNQTL